MAISWMMSSTSSSAFSTSMILMATEWPVRLSTLKGRRIASQQQSPAIPFSFDRKGKDDERERPSWTQQDMQTHDVPLEHLAKATTACKHHSIRDHDQEQLNIPPTSKLTNAVFFRVQKLRIQSLVGLVRIAGVRVRHGVCPGNVILVTGNVNGSGYLRVHQEGSVVAAPIIKPCAQAMAQLAACVREQKRQFSVYVNESRKPRREAGNGRWCLMMHGIKGMRWKRPNVVSVAWSWR